MEIKFVPEACKGKSPQYKGHIVILVPRAPERHAYMREAGVAQVIEKSNAVDEGKSKVKMDLASQWEVMGKMMGFVEKHLKEVSLERKDGYKIDSADKLMSVSSCEEIVMEIVGLFMEGFEPGKNSEA